MKISIVIVHWKTPELLKKQLAGLQGFSGEVIVVNNDPTALSAKQFSVENLTIINNQINRGFAFACNQGLRSATGDWLVFLNPDVQLSGASVESFVRETMQQGLIAASPTTTNEAYQKPVPSFWSLMTEFSFLRRCVPLSLFQPATLIGGCLCVQRQALLEAGGWDERYFLWFEDSDLTKRFQLRRLPFGRVSGIEYEHQGGASFQDMSSAIQRQIFFVSFTQYTRVFLNAFEAQVLRRLTKRFSSNRLLPADSAIRASIVVPNQKPELLESFLQRNSGFFDFTTDELIVVSSAPNLAQWKAAYPDVIFIQLAENLGFAATVNIGLRRARGEYLGTVNDDTTLSKNWIENSLTAFAKDVGTVTPLILTPDGQVESCGIDVFPFGRAQVHKELPPKRSRESAAFNGACVLFQRSALEAVGLFDERFHSYLEDIDLGLRMHRAGWKHVAVKDVAITHFGQQTSKHMSTYKHWLDVRNWWFVLLKNYPARHWLRHFGPILVERARNLSGFLKSLG